MKTKAKYYKNKCLIKLWICPNEEIKILKILKNNKIELEEAFNEVI